MNAQKETSYNYIMKTIDPETILANKYNWKMSPMGEKILM